MYVNKDEARPNSLKTNENKTVLILDSYYNNTNLNLWKKNSFEREHFTEVSVKNNKWQFRRKSKRTPADTNPITASKLTKKDTTVFKLLYILTFILHCSFNHSVAQRLTET